MLHWVRAGHPPVLVYDPANDRFKELRGKGLPLGVDADYQYNENIDGLLTPGQIILVGTDRIWESEDRSGVRFGHERFCAVIRRHAAKPARSILDSVYADIKALTAEALPRNDITLVVVKIGPLLTESSDWQI